MNCGVYVHIPFCRAKCDYCSFYSIPFEPRSADSKDLLTAYINRIVDEIVSFATIHDNCTIDTIYFGGGTPSLVDAAQLSAIISTIRNAFQITDDCEITIECNPEDCIDETISSLVDIGANRITLGVQNVFSSFRSHIGRASNTDVMRALEIFFSVDGFIRCVDYIVGIPGQTGIMLRNELRYLIEYRPQHISAYLFTVEPGSPYHFRHTAPIDFDDTQLSLFDEAIDMFSAFEYTQYEISNFARDGFQSRHNSKYWNWEPYLGFGAGAHSFFNGIRWHNPTDVFGYINASESIPDNRSIGLQKAEYVLSVLRRSDGLSFQNFSSTFHTCIPDHMMNAIERHCSMGTLERRHKEVDFTIRLTRAGIHVMDSVVYDLTEGFL